MRGERELEEDQGLDAQRVGACKRREHGVDKVWTGGIFEQSVSHRYCIELRVLRAGGRPGPRCAEGSHLHHGSELFHGLVPQCIITVP